MSIEMKPGHDWLRASSTLLRRKALNELGITLMHPVAIEQAGQGYGRELRGSVDGGFDRISMSIEPQMAFVERHRQLAVVLGVP